VPADRIHTQLISRSRDKTIFFCIFEKQNNNNHKLDTTTFSERSKYIIVLNSCFTLNHRGKKSETNRPTFDSGPMWLYYTRRYDIVMAHW